MSPPNPDLIVITAGPSVFRAEDRTDGRFYILGTLAGGMLRFEVVAQLADGTRGTVRGREFFDAMMDHFGARVRVIEATWTRRRGRSANLELFIRAVAAGIGSSAAALTATRTGRWANTHGYSRATVTQLRPVKAIGKYRLVIVQFSK